MQTLLLKRSIFQFSPRPTQPAWLPTFPCVRGLEAQLPQQGPAAGTAPLGRQPSSLLAAPPGRRIESDGRPLFSRDQNPPAAGSLSETLAYFPPCLSQARPVAPPPASFPGWRCSVHHRAMAGQHRAVSLLFFPFPPLAFSRRRRRPVAARGRGGGAVTAPSPARALAGQ